MTCIAAIVDSKGVGHIACDSLGSSYSSKAVYTNRKIFTVGDMLIGRRTTPETTPESTPAALSPPSERAALSCVPG